LVLCDVLNEAAKDDILPSDFEGDFVEPELDIGRAFMAGGDAVLYDETLPWRSAFVLYAFESIEARGGVEGATWLFCVAYAEGIDGTGGWVPLLYPFEGNREEVGVVGADMLPSPLPRT
jgi:hypothetical protein